MKIRKATVGDYPIIMEIWKSSVKATHNFLKQDDFELFKHLIPAEFLPQLNVFVMEDDGNIPAFFAVSADNLEMLFVDAASMGRGLGKLQLNMLLTHCKFIRLM